MKTAAAQPQSDLTLTVLAAMLANAGGLEAFRHEFVDKEAYIHTPIGALAKRYLDALRFDNYSPKTIKNREQTLGWLAFDHPELEADAVTYELLRAFLEDHWRDAAPNTKSFHVSSLRAFFGWAFEYDHVPSNPAKKLKSPRATDTDRRAHSRSVIKGLIVAQDDRRDRVAIMLMYWCALRRDELRRVQFRHIDLARRVLTVFGKGGTVLEQSISEPLALELERHIQDSQCEADEYLLFPRKVGRRGAWPAYSTETVWEDRLRPYTESGIDRWWQRCRKNAGLDDKDNRMLMHELRHSAGTHMHETGHDLVSTQYFMRHRSASTTQRTYIHLDRVKQVAGVQRLMRDPMAEES